MSHAPHAVVLALASAWILAAGPARALEPPGPSVAIMPTPERLLIDLADVPEALSGPGHCLYRISQGGQTFAHRVDFEDVWDVYDLGGLCVVDQAAFEGLVWPGALAVEAELEVGGAAVALAPSRYDPAADGLFDPVALQTRLREMGWEVTEGEAAASFGQVFYREWFLERGAQSASLSTYIGTPDRFTPTQVGCAPRPEEGDQVCRHCGATFCADLVLFDDASQQAHAALREAMGALGAALEGSGEPATP